MMDDNCIFCKIIKGDIPSNKVYEDDKMIAIHDVAPAAPVHVLLLPKEHTANVTTADPALVAYMLGKVKEIAEKTGASTATISRVNRCCIYGAGGYKTVLDRLEGVEE